MTIKSGMDPVHPGQVLREELDELGLSASALASAIGVPADRVAEILDAERGIDANLAMRLGRYFNTTARFWLNLQQAWAEKRDSRQVARTCDSIAPLGLRSPPAVGHAADVMAVRRQGIADAEGDGMGGDARVGLGERDGRWG